MFSDNFQSVIDYCLKLLKDRKFDSYQLTNIDRLHSLTRFAKSTIHQNVSDHTLRILLKASKGKKISSISLTSLTKPAVKNAVIQLEKNLAFVPDTPFYQGMIDLPSSPPQKLNAVGSLLDEYQRAEYVETAVNAAEEVDKNVNLAGSVFITDLKFNVINSSDINFDHQLTYNGLIVNSLTEGENKGYAKEEQYARDPTNLSPADLARAATEMSLTTCSAKNYSNGKYEVVLSPYATSTLLMFLSFGFNAVSYNESQSFIADQIGSQLFDSKLTLLDDPLNEETLLAHPFDGEGSIKSPYFLVEDGVPKTVLYNSFMASKYLEDKTKSTGHQIIPYSDYVFGGIVPLNLILARGESSVDEMIAETKDGFFINRLHYTNFVNRRLGAITGLTRDGLLKIEDGEIVGAAKNFRFTDKIPEILHNIPLIGSDVHVGLRSVLPAMKLESFNFSGKSTH